MKKKVLIVGQVPPPFGGQAIMIQYLLDAHFKNIEKYHVVMRFSRDFGDRGKFSLYKVLHLFRIVINIWFARFKHGANIMYYPISSAPKVALLRDAFILGSTRFLFNKVIYHFHAAGVSEELPKYKNGLRQIVFSILKHPSLGITSSEYNPKDSEFLKSEKSLIIPLGIPDLNKKEERNFDKQGPGLTVLFMGLLNSTKGEGYVLEAIHKLNLSGRPVRFIFAGKFESEDYKKVFFERIRDYNLAEQVDYRGVVTGEEKKKIFMEADVFCFPSFFSSESFGLVLLESMMYQMPIIASRWRGLQSVVENGKNGFLVDVRNSEQIAQSLIKLYDDRSLLVSMGKEARKMFVEKFSLNIYLHNMEDAICKL